MKLKITEEQLKRLVNNLNEGSGETDDTFEEWISRSKSNDCPKYLNSSKLLDLYWDFNEFTNNYNYSILSNWNDTKLVNAILQLSNSKEFDLLDEAIGCRRFQLDYKKKNLIKFSTTKSGHIENILKQMLTGVAGLGQGSSKEKVKSHLNKIGKKIDL